MLGNARPLMVRGGPGKPESRDLEIPHLGHDSLTITRMRIGRRHPKMPQFTAIGVISSVATMRRAAAPGQSSEITGRAG